MARQFRIVVRRRRGPNDIVSTRDFLTGAGTETSLAAWARRASIVSPYAIDFRRREVTFVVTDEGVDLAKGHPFFYQAQRLYARQLIVASFAEVEDVASWLSLPPHHLVHLYSPGRSGSTITGALAARLPEVQQLSEPDFFTQLVHDTAVDRRIDRAEAVRAIAAVSRLLIHHRLAIAPTRPTILIKHRGAALYAAERIHAATPQSTALFLHRNAADVIDSYISAFASNPLLRLVRRMGLDHWIVRVMRSLSPHFAPAVPRLMPLVVEPRLADRNSHGLVEVLALGFHSMMLEASRLVEQRGFQFAAVLRYEDLSSTPATYVRGLADALRVRATDAQVDEALVALNTNSQEGSSIASSGSRALSAGDVQRVERTLRQLQGPALVLGGAS